MTPSNANANHNIPAHVCCPKGAWCPGKIPTYKLVFDKSEGRNPECKECGIQYKIPQGIPKDPKKVPRPARSKTPTRPIHPKSQRSLTPKPPKKVSIDEKDQEIKRLRQLNRELKQKAGNPSQDDTQHNDDLENLKEARRALGIMEKLGLDKTETQAKIDALEIKCAKVPPNANSETLKRKLRNAENRANQIAQNVHKTELLLESQKTALGDAEEEVIRLTEEHQQALKNEGFEKAAVPEALLTIPEYLQGTQRDAYQAKLEELKAERTRYEQATAAITGNLQAYTKTNAPKDEKKEDGDDKMEEDTPNRKESIPPNPPKEDEAAKIEKRAKADQAGKARVETIAAEAKKQRCGEQVAIEEEKEDF